MTVKLEDSTVKVKIENQESANSKSAADDASKLRTITPEGAATPKIEDSHVSEANSCEKPKLVANRRATRALVNVINETIKCHPGILCSDKEVCASRESQHTAECQSFCRSRAETVKLSLNAMPYNYHDVRHQRRRLAVRALQTVGVLPKSKYRQESTIFENVTVSKPVFTSPLLASASKPPMSTVVSSGRASDLLAMRRLDGSSKIVSAVTLPSLPKIEDSSAELKPSTNLNVIKKLQPKSKKKNSNFSYCKGEEIDKINFAFHCLSTRLCNVNMVPRSRLS